MDNEVSVGALNHLMLKGIPRRLYQSLRKIVRELHQLINLIWGLFCWHLHKPSENYSYCIPIQYLNSKLKCLFCCPLGVEINFVIEYECRLFFFLSQCVIIWGDIVFDKTIYFVSNILLSNKTSLHCCRTWGFVPFNAQGRGVKKRAPWPHWFYFRAQPGGPATTTGAKAGHWDIARAQGGQCLEIKASLCPRLAVLFFLPRTHR